jgi:hypothetical protein
VAKTTKKATFGYAIGRILNSYPPKCAFGAVSFLTVQNRSNLVGTLKLKAHQQNEIVHLVNSGKKTAADAAKLFNVHPATVSRLLQRDKAP